MIVQFGSDTGHVAVQLALKAGVSMCLWANKGSYKKQKQNKKRIVMSAVVPLSVPLRPEEDAKEEIH